MNHKSRLAKLEAQAGSAQHIPPKPSEILARADELIRQGAQPTDSQRRALDSIRRVVA